MTIGKKFVLVFSIFLVAVLIGAFFVFKTTREQQSDLVVVNLAANQRMLTQKYFKEYINELMPRQIRYSTIKAAEIATIQIVEDRKQYTKNIIAKLKKDGIANVHPNRNYTNLDGGIPLPATFVQEVSSTINKQGVYSYDLLSKWNINKKKNLRTDFEREAFDFLYQDKGNIFLRFMEHNGIFTLRYATPDVAGAETCVKCHNSHDDSPKKDFKLGEVMGILVVNIPIGTMSAKTEAFFADSGDGEFGEDTFLKTKKVFDTTLGALISGGKAPLDMEMKKFTTLPACNDRPILAKLIEARKYWNTTQANLQALLDTEINSAEYIVAYDDAFTSANSTMHAINDAAALYQVESKERMSMLLKIQTLSVIIVCAVIGLGWLLFARPLISFLSGLVAKLSDSSEQIASAAEELSSAGQSLAQGSSEQASSLEETSASMEEMSSMTKQNAKNAEETSKLVDVCIVDAENGNKAAAEVSNSMEEIASSSKKIAEITKIIDGIASQTNALALKAGQDTSQIIKQGNSFAVVAKEVRNLANKSMAAAKDTSVIVQSCLANTDKLENEASKNKEFNENIKKIARGIKDIETIAFQTNLLALNAAVEAVRASDNGEKFAAVTEEVGNLAKKSADAAKDTTVLIGECVQRAGEGTRIAAKCKEDTEHIVKDVKRAAVLTKEITEASAEQSEGINQVSNAVQQMDQVTQQTAATAEETASASEELAAQAQTMKEQINILAMQVDGKGKGEHRRNKTAKPDNVISSQVPEQNITDVKTSGKSVLKLISSPIYILKSIAKLRKRDDSNKGIKSEPMDPPVPDNETGDNGNGRNEDVLVKTNSNESIIPKGENRILEHDESFKDF
jgi:Methyl-accepting chemotaxis protein